MNRKIFLTCWGGVGAATGANFMLENEDGNFRVLVDCGLLQGLPEAREINRQPFAYDPRSVKMLFVTHAHADHIGRIPALVKAGFKGVIYSTPATRALSAVMLEDMVGIFDEEARRDGTLPIYGKKEVSETMSSWREIPYHTSREIAPGISVWLKDAGHILGSAIYEWTIGDSKIAFTGDLGNSPSPLLRDAESIEGARYALMESVYGDRNHEGREERSDKLKEIVLETIRRSGALLIPAFSLERTQVILHELNRLVESGALPPVPVFLDSPLAIRVTEIYKTMSADFNDRVKKEIAGGDDIFKFPRLKFTLHSRDSGLIANTPNPKVIIAGSGMSDGGRIRYHEARYLPDQKNTLLLVGYQSPGTLGRELLGGMKEVEINGERIPVRAAVKSIQGYSSHMDSDHLIEFVEKAGPSLRRVFVAMGEPRSSLFLAQRLRDYVGVEAIYPELGKKIPLEF